MPTIGRFAVISVVGRGELSRYREPHERKFAFLTFYRFIRSSQRVAGPIIDIDG
jgi:hypothetical protein